MMALYCIGKIKETFKKVSESVKFKTKSGIPQHAD